MLTIIPTIAKGIFELVKQFSLPLAAFLQGKKSQELKRLKQEAKDAKRSEKIRDGVTRASDSDLDDILHD